MTSEKILNKTQTRNENCCKLNQSLCFPSSESESDDDDDFPFASLFQSSDFRFLDVEGFDSVSLVDELDWERRFDDVLSKGRRLMDDIETSAGGKSIWAGSIGASGWIIGIGWGTGTAAAGAGAWSGMAGATNSHGWRQFTEACPNCLWNQHTRGNACGTGLDTRGSGTAAAWITAFCDAIDRAFETLWVGGCGCREPRIYPSWWSSLWDSRRMTTRYFRTGRWARTCGWLERPRLSVLKTTGGWILGTLETVELVERVGMSNKTRYMCWFSKDTSRISRIANSCLRMLDWWSKMKSANQSGGPVGDKERFWPEDIMIMWSFVGDLIWF